MLSKKKYKKYSQDIEPNQIFMDKLSSKQEEALGIPERKLEVPLYKMMINGLLVFCFLLLGGLLTKTVSIVAIDGAEYSKLAERNKYVHYKVQALRGVIYSSDMQQLVYNELSFDLVCNRETLFEDEKKDQSIILIADILKKEVDEVNELINNSEDNEFVLAEDVEHQQLLLLETEIDSLEGFSIINNTIRSYPDSNVFSHIIGYTGKISSEELDIYDNYSMSDYVGRSGLEKTYESVLHSKVGEISIERNSEDISKGLTSLPDSGDNLVLHIDYELQKKLSEVVKAKLNELGSNKAAAIAIDPRDGGILAMVSFPEYNNNVFIQGTDEEITELFNDEDNPLFNRAVSGQYPTGSTIKPLIALAALEEQTVEPDMTITDNLGYIEIVNEYDPSIVYRYRDNAIHGTVDMREAIAVSCNTYFFTIGGGYKGQEGLGVERIKKYLELFGWGKKTGVDLTGEKDGLVPNNEYKEEVIGTSWTTGDTYNLSIGQSYLLTTPLQVASAYVAIANGGTLYEPHLVEKIVDSTGNVISEIVPKIIRSNFFSQDSLKVIQEGMKETTISGTATSLGNLSVEVGAKTGTAETSYINTYHNWIGAYAPYDNPEIVLVVMVENVQGIRTATVPIARDVLEWYFTREDN